MWAEFCDDYSIEEDKTRESDDRMWNEKNWIVELDENGDTTWFAHITCDRREEAIEEGLKKAKIEGLKKFRIGRTIPCEVPKICADSIIENAQEQLNNEMGELADAYLDSLTKEQKEELEEEINKVFCKWNKKYKLYPECYKVVDEEYINVE